MAALKTDPSSAPPRRSAIRWWPAALVVSLSAGVWGWIWFWQDVHRQTKNLQTAGLLALTLTLLLLWALLLSRLRWKLRLLILGAVLSVGCFSAAALEIRGVTGDLLPILEWRWSRQAASLPAPSATSELASALPRPIPTGHDYPQFCGPSRSGVVSGFALSPDWQSNPPKELWRQPIGAGWSGFAVSGAYAVTLEQWGTDELVTCYRLLTGDLLWKHLDQARYESTLAGEGPRSVPTIADNRVYAVGATGNLNCLELADGKPVWSKDIIVDNNSSVPEWGVSGSPLVTDGMVVVSAGGQEGRSLAAYDKETGDLVWSGGDDRAHYSSPVLATMAGTRQILIFNRGGVAAHAIDTGQILWESKWPSGHPHIAMPLALPGDRVLLSSGYGTGSQLLHISRDAEANWSAEQVWRSKRLKSKFANLIFLDGYIYGLDDGVMACLDLTRGELQWKRGRYGHGQLILVGRQLLVMTERGDVALVEATPDAHRELTRFSALADKTWNPPALAGEYLLVRNDKEAACFRLPLVAP